MVVNLIDPDEYLFESSLNGEIRSGPTQAGLTNKTAPSSDRALLLMRAARPVQVQHRRSPVTHESGEISSGQTQAGLTNKTEPSSDRALLLMRAARSVQSPVTHERGEISSGPTQAGLTNKTEPSSDRALLLMRAARPVQVQHRRGLPTKQKLQAIEPCYSWERRDQFRSNTGGAYQQNRTFKR
ncbi:hypothetical protein J6590_099155 [Homalodisca vitripennis]|nr:hypothetical protein J6590_099155 [Homalodisca vitripennis]